MTLLNAGEQFVDLHNLKGWIKLSNRRLNTPDYSSRAVFEALVNAFIHRDYSELGSEVHIDIYDDRLVIYFPGGMFDGSLIQDRNLDDVSSKRRNPILADVFSQLNFMEKRGSGLRKICNESAKLPGFSRAKEPRFRSQATSFYTELLNNNYKKHINDPVNDPVRLQNLLQSDLITLLKEDPTITRPELCERLNVSLATIRRALAQLKNLKLIERVGSDKSGHWNVSNIIEKN
ncbi:MAG TPA: ATP-binding protein [Xylanibacter oryzae]|nr:ATP-binding protein [Xylanibacter oryzae]